MSDTVETPQVKFIEETSAPEVKVDSVSKQESEQALNQETKPDLKLGSKFAELTKKQRALYDKEVQVKEMESKYAPFEKALSEAKVNPLKLLEVAGITFEQITEYILNDGEDNSSQDTGSEVEKKLASLEEKILAKEKAEQEELDKQVNERVSKQINDFKASIKEQALSGTYELVNELEQHDLVYDVILEHHSSTGEVLPVDKALELTESYLNQQAEKVLKAKKITPTQATVPSRKPESTFTLSSQVNPSSTSSVSTERLTPEQARERAMALIKFQ